MKNTKTVVMGMLLSICCVGCCNAKEGLASNEFKKVSETIADDYSADRNTKNSFFSLISRMRYVKRWSLFKNTEEESLENHSFEVAVIAHALAIIKNEKFDGHVDENKAAVFGLFHDALEIITGDAPTPVKYFDPEMKKMYVKLEEKVSDEMLEKIEDDGIKAKYAGIISPKSNSETAAEEDKELESIVKAADDISALIKCLREKRAGNNDFDKVYERLYNKVKNNKSKEVEYFVDNYLESYCCE